jgi:hypothetical protein
MSTEDDSKEVVNGDIVAGIIYLCFMVHIDMLASYRIYVVFEGILCVAGNFISEHEDYVIIGESPMIF